MEKNEILAQLDSMKTALESNLTEKANASVKNVEEKIAAINSVVEEVKSKPQVSVEEFNTIKSKLDATVAALDMVQMRPAAQKSAPKTWRAAIVDTLEENKGAISNMKSNKSEKFQVKDFTTGSIDGAIPNSYAAGLVSPPYEMVHARSIFPVTPSDTDSFHFYQHAASSSLAFQTNEGTAKQALTETLTENTVNLNYLAGFVRVSKKMLRNFRALQSYLGQWLPEEYYNAEDTEAASALNSCTGTPITSGSSMVENIVLTIGSLMASKQSVNCIIVNGTTWGTIMANKTTANEFTLPGAVTVAANGQLLIAGIPVYVASWVPSYNAYVGDKNKFTIVQSEGLSVQFFEQDSDNVQKNLITARVEASVGFALLDAGAFARINMD